MLGSIKLGTGSGQKGDRMAIEGKHRESVHIDAANSGMKRFGGKGFSLEMNCFNGRHSGPRIMSKTPRITAVVSSKVFFGFFDGGKKIDAAQSSDPGAVFEHGVSEKSLRPDFSGGNWRRRGEF